MTRKILHISTLFITLLCLSGCNAGTTYSLLDDVKLNNNGTVTTLDGGKPKKKRIVYYGEFSNLVFYDKNITKEDRDKFKLSNENADVESELRCVFKVWFVPVNFWTYFYMSPESLIKQTIEDANKMGKSGHLMKYIVTHDHWLGGLLSYDCRSLTGKIYNQK